MVKSAYCAALVALGLATWWAVSDGWMTPTLFKKQLVEISLQVLLFGLAGGFVKLLLDRAAEKRTFRSEVLRLLGQAHRTVYRVRRLLTIEQTGQYSQLLGDLMDARQDLGSISHEIRIRGLLKTRKEIQNEIDSMRVYLENVIEGAITKNEAHQHAYAEFLDFGGSGQRYKQEFKDRYIRTKELVDPSYKWPGESGNPPADLATL